MIVRRFEPSTTGMKGYINYSVKLNSLGHGTKVLVNLLIFSFFFLNSFMLDLLDLFVRRLKNFVVFYFPCWL